MKKPQVVKSFQKRVNAFIIKCFGPRSAKDKANRAHRFLEESIELAQSMGCNSQDAHALVDYVFGRPIGDIAQETGGVMLTLAALCNANNIDMQSAGEDELDRVTPLIEKIRDKEKSRPKFSATPGK